MEQFPRPGHGGTDPQESLASKAQKAARSLAAGAALTAAAFGTAEGQHSRTMAAHEAAPDTAQLIESLRAQRMAVLDSQVSAEAEALRVHDDRDSFKASYLRAAQQEARAYVDHALVAETARIKASVQGLTEDEIRLLSDCIASLPASAERAQHMIEEGTAADEAQDRIDDNTQSAVDRHPRIKAALESLRPWAEFNGKEFAKHLSSIHPLDSAEKAKRPSEVFRKAVDMVAQDRAAFAREWLKDKAADSSVEAAWKERPSKEYLRLALQKDSEELASVAKNLHEPAVRADIDSGRAWVAQYIASPEYARKLMSEGMSADEAARMQAKRLKAVQDMAYGISPEYMGNSNVSGEAGGPLALSYNAYDVAHEPEGNPRHEWTHVALGGAINMTPTERAVYEAARISDAAYDSVERTPLGQVAWLDMVNPFQARPNSAFVSPAELAARKMVLEGEMEQLGIKKRFEPMTHAHYLQLVRLMETGKLGRNSMQIILTTTESGLLSVMNDLAYEAPRTDTTGPVA